MTTPSEDIEREAEEARARADELDSAASARREAEDAEEEANAAQSAAEER